MSKTAAGQLQEIGGRIEQFTRPEIRTQVMTGSEQAAAASDPAATALWVKAAMDRLDALVPSKERQSLMAACGHNCFARNPKPLADAKKRRKQFYTEIDFLEAEIEHPPRGMRLERKGDVLLFYYTPRRFGKGMRCYCALVKALPPEVTASPTYCHCGRGFVEKYWEGLLGRPVKVELAASSVSGSEECCFIVHI